MNRLFDTPLEQLLADAWRGIDTKARAAFFVAVAVSLLAFGFEMTNLTLHHDDVVQIFIEDTILGHYLGRFGTGWLHYYTQGAHIMPFLQMAQGIVIMAVYGVLVARFWGARSTPDLALVACIACVFPYLAQVYQYNSTQATYSVAHLMAAAAVVLSVRRSLWALLASALLYLGAFSIYQGVAANAATIFFVWWLMRLLRPIDGQNTSARGVATEAAWAAGAALLGGALYYAAVSQMTIAFDGYQSAEKALRPGGGVDLGRSVPAIIAASRSSYLWPETYIPGFLKSLQMVFVGGMALACLLLPRTWLQRLLALALLPVVLISPRLLQLMHAEGRFHELTLTAYALVFAAAVLAVRQAGPVLLRNAAMLGGALLVGGYVVQCAWISTINHLNTQAHLSTTTQVLARLRSMPDAGWDGRKVVVVGEYDMREDYPFKRATGVASEFMRAHHMNLMARLLRDEASFVKASDATPAAIGFAQAHPPWPHPASVGVVEGTAVVVLSKPK